MVRRVEDRGRGEGGDQSHLRKRTCHEDDAYNEGEGGGGDQSHPRKRTSREDDGYNEGEGGDDWGRRKGRVSSKKEN